MDKKFLFLCVAAILIFGACNSDGTSGGGAVTTGGGNMDCSTYATTGQVESAFGLSSTTGQTVTSTSTYCEYGWSTGGSNIILNVWNDGSQSMAEAQTQTVCPSSGYTLESSNVGIGDGIYSCTQGYISSGNCLIGILSFSVGAMAVQISVPGSSSNCAAALSDAETLGREIAANL